MTNLSGTNLNNGEAVGPQGEGRESPSNFPKYSAYKDSGVEWLGAVPEGWELIPFKYVAEFVNGMAFKPEQWSEVGIPIIRIENLNNGESFNYFEGTVEERYHVKTGDLLFGWSGNRGTSFGPFLWHGVGLHYLNQHIFRIADFRCDKKWLYWALKAVTKTIEDQAHGIIGMVHVTKGKLGGIKIPLLPHPEQTQIARFLDHETARIDALIEEQQRLIELLKEKRQAIISHAVTKGLDPTVQMKDSGVEWLGEVPAHWVVADLKWFWSVTDCKHITAEFVDDGTPLASIREVQCRYVTLENAKQTTEVFYRQLIEAGRKPVAGDLIFSRNATVGEVAQVADWHPPFAMGQDVCLLKKQFEWLSSDYLQAVLRSPVVTVQLDNLMIGSTFKRVNVEDIRGLVVPMPPEDEQQQIAEYLNSEAGLFDSLLSECKVMIGLLQERRSALISAAVTGKIDVRGWQPPASTQTPEFEVAEAH